MPELAEVEFYRRQWDACLGQTITGCQVRPMARVFREGDGPTLARNIVGTTLAASSTHGKNLLFSFDGGSLHVHLGMSGELLVEGLPFWPRRHDHLVLYTAEDAFVFRDERMFGLARWFDGPELPAWWRSLPPEVTSAAFTGAYVASGLRRRARTPIKSALLDQDIFPGIGNWMADEVLWRAEIHPLEPAGKVAAVRLAALHAAIREVAAEALAVIGGVGARTLPSALNERVPDGWLFNHRHAKGHSPRTGAALTHLVVGGRSTYFEPGRQFLLP